MKGNERRSGTSDLTMSVFSMTEHDKKDTIENEVDSHGTSSEPQDKSTDIQKLQDILKIVKTWERVPENIKRQIDVLHVNICQKENSLLLSRRHDYDDTSRKIQPLFPHRAKHSQKRGKLSVVKKGGITQVKSEEELWPKVKKQKNRRKYRAKLHVSKD